MARWMKAFTALTALVLATGIGFAARGVTGGTSPAKLVSFDVKGPCDEAEHAGDPRCAGASVTPEDSPTTAPDRDRGGQADDSRGERRSEVESGNEQNEDISGPCDEAEHASDPRCTGVGTERDDNSGPGPGDSSGRGHDGDTHDDHSGHGGESNSGKIEDHSGRGEGGGSHDG